MKRLNPWLLFVAVQTMNGADNPKGIEKPYPVTGEIERLDPAMDDLIERDAALEKLAVGFDWSEGPVWIKDGSYLLFSDIPPNNIWKWKDGDGLSLYLHPSGYTGTAERGGEVGSNGLAIDNQGRLILCQHGDRRIARMNAPISAPRPEFETLADRWDNRRFNSPNDLVIHPDGAIYFTDPAYGLEQRMEDPAKEIDFQGVYRLAPDGTVTLVEKELTRPNGLAFSPDARTLYVGNSDGGARAIWNAYEVKTDGTLGDGRLFACAGPMKKEGRTGSPDGFKIDIHGNFFASGPGGILVFSPEGKHLGNILTGQGTSNCAFGDDGRTLYITADMFLMRVRLKTTGMGF